MAEHSSFFNSVSGDRLYKAEDFAKYFSSFISNGIFPNPSTNLQVMANGDMTITIKAGSAWINGYFYYLDADTTFTIETADGTLNRIDRIVVHLDIAGRAINVKVLKGVIASSPTAPTLQRDADGYDLALADIAINAGVTSISQSNITDQRQNQDLCGIVDSLITADTATLFNQFTDGFNSWFAGIKNTLGEDAAGNLLNKINELAGTGRTTETVKGNADNITSLNNAVKGNADNITSLNNAVTAHLSENASSAHKDKNIAVMDANSHFTATNLDGVLDELFTNANDGKTGIANAVTAKGVPASPSDTFSALADKIGQINTGKKWASGTVSDVNSKFTVNNLDFKPSVVILYSITPNPQYYVIYLPEMIDWAHASGVDVKGNPDRTSTSIVINTTGFVVDKPATQPTFPSTMNYKCFE